MKIRILILLCCLPILSRAQDAYTMKFLPQLQQSQWSCASNETDAKISVGIPVLSSTSFYLFNSGFTYHSLFHKVNDSTTAIHPGDVINKLKSKNYIGFGASVTLLSFNYARPDWSVGFSITDKADLRFQYPKDLLNLLWNGNGAYLGKTLEIGNFGLNASWYREYALHGVKSYKKWTFGASPKLLFGKTNINTRSSSVGLYTAPDYYDITATANMNIQTSGIADSNDRKNGIPGASEYIFNNKNRGLGLDLGAKYQYNDKIAISAGINNLGYIKWKGQVHNYTAAGTTFNFDGFHAENFFQGDTGFISASQLTDSVTKLIKFDKNSDAYTTTLPYELYAMGTYQLNKHNMFGLQLNAERFSKNFLLAATLCYQFQAGKHFTGTLTYTAKSNTPFNLGGAIIVRLACVQLYMATDNWWASVKPLDSKNMNLHFGINLAFGSRLKKVTDAAEPNGTPAK